MYFTLSVHSDTGFASEILELFLDLRSFIVEKVDSHSQIVPSIPSNRKISFKKIFLS